MICLLVDAQLPPALARFLMSKGYQAEHVLDIGMREAEDTPIWNYALLHGAAIITKDEDFAHRLSQGEKAAPAIVWVRIGNTSRRELLSWIGALMPQIEVCIARGDQLIEVR